MIYDNKKIAVQLVSSFDVVVATVNSFLMSDITSILFLLEEQQS